MTSSGGKNLLLAVTTVWASVRAVQATFRLPALRRAAPPTTPNLVEVALAKSNDPGIPPGTDLAFICDVIHHVAEREAWLRKAFEELKPGGKLVVIEFKEGSLPQGPPERMKIPRARLIELIEQAGFRLAAEDPGMLPYQLYLTFEKPPARVDLQQRGEPARARIATAPR